jgi:hypothetical protein
MVRECRARQDDTLRQVIPREKVIGLQNVASLAATDLAKLFISKS